MKKPPSLAPPAGGRIVHLKKNQERPRNTYDGDSTTKPRRAKCGCGVAVFYRDVRGNLIGEADSRSKTTTNTYDGARNRTSRKTPTGDITTYQYDQQNRAHTIAYPAIMIGQQAVSPTVVYSYDLNGNLASVKDLHFPKKAKWILPA